MQSTSHPNAPLRPFHPRRDPPATATVTVLSVTSATRRFRQATWADLRFGDAAVPRQGVLFWTARRRMLCETLACGSASAPVEESRSPQEVGEALRPA